MATKIQDTTNSTSGSTGAFVVMGGVGIKKDLFVEGNINVTGTTNFPPDPNVQTELNNINNELADLQAAVGSVNDAATSAANAYASEQAAIAAKNEAVIAKGEAAGSASQSATSASNASSSATQAGNSATASANSKDLALTYSTNAGNSASLASTKADLASTSASAAGNSATAASTHASSAYTSAQNAANSAAAAAVDYSSLSARMGTAEANITSEASTRASADTAISTNVTNLTSTVNGHTTTLTTQASSINGLNARWGVTVNNNGVISGIVLNSTGASNGGTPTTAVVIAANSFAIVDPFTAYTSGTTPSASSIPFEVTGGVTYLKSAAIKQNISSYNFNPATNTGWNIDRGGNILTYGNLEIRDSSGAIVLSTGGNMDFNRINGSTKPENNATFGANGSNLSISNSGNLLPNSDFVTNPLTNNSWVLSWNAGGGTNYTIAWDLAGSYWAPAGGHTLGAVRNGTLDAASSWFDILYDKYIPMQPGISFELSAYLAAHRCGVEIRIAYYNASQVYISETGWGTSNPGPSGGNDLNNWARHGGIATTPANTAYVRIFIRGSGVQSGQSEPYFWATKIFFGLTKSGQTQLSPWSAATSSGAFAELNQINGSNATTYIANAAIGNALIANLSAEKINAGYLDAARIDVKTLNANKIVNNTLNKINSVYASASQSDVANNTFTGVLSVAKSFSHRDSGDLLLLTLFGSCDAGTISLRKIGFGITGSAVYWWDSAIQEYKPFSTTTVSSTDSIGGNLLTYVSTADSGARNASSNLTKLVKYLPTYNHATDYATYSGDILTKGSITVYFCIQQNSGAVKSATERTITVWDTYA